MTRHQGWLAFLILALAACSSAPRAQVGAPRLPKGGESQGGGGQIELTRVPGRTPTPTFAPTATSPLSRTWPEPNTYAQVAASSTAVPSPAQPFNFSSDVVNILLLGSDRRPASSSYRTDVIILLSIHPGAGGAAMISIPRDLYVYIPGFRVDRINTAFALGENYAYPGGGLGLLGDTILYNLGIPVQHFARIEMDGFRDAIDTLGGVEVDVACGYTDWRLKNPSLDPENEDNWALFTTRPGVVRMDGEYALWYARSRQKSSDFDRSRRQHEVLRAVYRRLLRFDLIPQIPVLYGEMSHSITTDLGLADLLRLAPLAGRIEISHVRSRFIGRQAVTSWRTPSGAQVLLPKPEEVRRILEDAFAFESPDPLLPSSFHTVEVINASSHQDWGELASERLVYAGFSAHVGAPAPSPGARTQVIDYGIAGPDERTALLQELGLPSSALISQPEPASPFPFRAVIGEDYNPCFDPTTLPAQAGG